MFQGQRALGVFGVQFVKTGFAFHIDVVEQAIDHVAVRIDDPIAHDDFRSSALRGVSRKGQGFQPVLLTGRLEVGIEQIEVDQRLLLRTKLHRSRQAQTLLIVGQPTIAREARRVDIGAARSRKR